MQAQGLTPNLLHLQLTFPFLSFTQTKCKHPLNQTCMDDCTDVGYEELEISHLFVINCLWKEVSKMVFF